MNNSAAHTKLKIKVCAALGARRGIVLMNNPVGFDPERKITYGLAKGSADLIACIYGRFVGLEVKTGSGERSKEQEAWALAITNVGGVVAEVRSVQDAVDIYETLAEKETT